MFEIQRQYFAFNIWDTDSARSVMDAAGECSCDVILQTSSRVFEGMERTEVRSFVTHYASKAGIKAYLHLDHCRHVDTIKQAVDCGWDSVMLDASHLPLESNILLTNSVCSYAHGRGVLVEAEVGCIPGTEDDVMSDAHGIADMDDVRSFLLSTNVDLFAAAIGTAHGLYKSAPNIRYDLIKRIGQLTDKPFVIHGGSGLSDFELQKLLSFDNVGKINISTELKQAFRRGIVNAQAKGLLAREGFEVIPIKTSIYQEIKRTAANKLQLLKGRKGNEQKSTCS